MTARTKLIVLATAVIAVVGGYTGAWFYFAGALKESADAYITGLTGEDIDAACVNLDVAGYPLDIGITCDAICGKNRTDGSSLRAGALHSTARMLRPRNIVSTLDGPLTATGPDGNTLSASWSSMQAVTVFRRKGLSHGALAATQFQAALTGPIAAGTLRLKSPAFEIHAGQHGRNLDAAFTVDKLAVAAGGQFVHLPVVDVSGTAALTDMAYLLSGRQPVPEHLLRGTSGTLTRFDISFENGASLSLAGPFSFDDGGRLSGRFDLNISNLAAWQQTIGTVLPAAHQTITSAIAMLTALAGENGTASITVTADHGRLSLGLIPLGKLPPI